MSKFGVGVGEDFPVDEQAQGQEQESGCCGGGMDRDEAIRKWRQMRSEWRARKRAMREQFRREFADEGHREHAKHVAGSLAVAVLAFVGLAALLGRHHHSD